MSCGVGCRGSSDLAWLWLWLWLAVAALIGPLAWEPPYAVRVALEVAKRQKKKKKKEQLFSQKLGAMEQESIISADLGCSNQPIPKKVVSLGLVLGQLLGDNL